MFKKIVIAVLLVAALATLGVGIALAQEDTPPPEDTAPVSGECPPCPCAGEGGRGPRGGGRPGRGERLEALAEALDMAPEDVRQALMDGQTIAELAEAQGVALEDLVEVLIAPAEEHLQQAVADGRLTQEQADERLAEMRERMLEHFESGEFGGPGGGGMPHGGPGGRGRGGRRRGGMHGPRFPGGAPEAEE